jgi:ribosome-associated protein
MISVTSTLSIDDNELEFSFIRASGPGGQNVNKVATAVQLRFDAAGARSLPEEVRTRLLALAGKRVTAGGVVVITAQRFRTQNQNRADAIERLVLMVRNAARPVRKRIATRPTRAARARRLERKRQRGDLKRQRAADSGRDTES